MHAPRRIPHVRQLPSPDRTLLDEQARHAGSRAMLHRMAEWAVVVLQMVFCTKNFVIWAQPWLISHVSGTNSLSRMRPFRN